mgnify:CR=1 FL=1
MVNIGKRFAVSRKSGQMQSIKQTCLVFATLCFAVAVSQNCHADAEGPIEFSIRNVVDGSTFSTADHKGKCMVIIFGSMYCKPCIQMIPVINQLYDTYKEAGFTAAGIDVDVCTDNVTLKNFAAEKGVRFHFLLGGPWISKKYSIFLLPTILVIDSEGTITKRYTNFQSYSVLEKQVKKCLAERQRRSEE